MRLLVTGGSGFLGINLLRRLAGEGRFDACSLDLVPLAPGEVPGARGVVADIRDRRAVREAVAGVDAVVHCAAALPLCPPAEIRSTEVTGTRVLLEEAARAGCGRFVFVSSTAVYGVPRQVPVQESDPLSGVGPYGRAKIAAEQACVAARQGGMCVSILRPKSFIGPERLGVFSLLFDWAIDGHGFPVLGRGDNRYQLLDVEDLCDSILLCLQGDRRDVSDVFNVGAVRFATMREDFQAVLDDAGHGARVRGIPAVPAVALLRALEVLRLSPLYRWVYETAGKESVVSVEKAGRVLGLRPRYSNRDALLRNFRWYRENRARVRGRVGVAHRDQWRQGVLHVAKAFF